MGTPRAESTVGSFDEVYSSSFSGGVNLLVPMLVTSLPKMILKKCLITTKVIVMIFVAGLFLIFEPSNAETLLRW